ncbi:two-component system response regulator [candidate division WOR-1 bacterium RIFOXYA12_FULL_43_27]|uniref:Two-component system response regulator n=1 Tax=candidate division WOR-1 bacterium RIFOXYC2_FULL_46_14 TaxID=1802587 RepID=A0A1F4U4Q2_UNCSA|nr:MAG: two-component system response regulator [candidate division WOR-1 bacterium RIFOXYA12_FULL_43_27]OGC18873.1 MAG: two-component system response regulator [candidate division WOR-1 bacterium RIFOXYB2_FULL_46_45]OGC29014.1 MAG: two-component system response regulator [candidate division WOR-1 bacterium RIFOXYA2_FULL_46_56]OGC39273.1 MAG: two-component system response regulator [candidate division WOR-1 bacterium RIFOXYC2_FULL_46_14]
MAKKILLVDDEPELVEMVKMRLAANGFEVITAGDGVEGLEKARSEKPDLIILDLMLPKMNGYEVCRLLKFEEKTGKIPIILFSARAQESDKATGKDVGADAYIVKPFEPQALIAKINELLKG